MIGMSSFVMIGKLTRVSAPHKTEGGDDTVSFEMEVRPRRGRGEVVSVEVVVYGGLTRVMSKGRLGSSVLVTGYFDRGPNGSVVNKGEEIAIIGE